MATSSSPAASSPAAAKRSSIRQILLVSWLLAAACGAACLYFLLVPSNPHPFDAPGLPAERCGSALAPGPDYQHDGECGTVRWHRWHRWAAGGLGAGTVIFFGIGLEEALRRRQATEKST